MADSWRAEGQPFLLGGSVVLVFSPALTKLTAPRMFPLSGHTEAIGLVSLGLFAPHLPKSLTLRASRDRNELLPLENLHLQAGRKLQSETKQNPEAGPG